MIDIKDHEYSSKTEEILTEHSDLMERLGEVEAKELDMTKGLRFNKGKIDYTQLSPIGQEMEARVYMYGAMKYFRDNFKNGKDTFEEAAQEFLECSLRHIQTYRKGEWYDDESLLPHLTHAVWNLNRIIDFYYHGMNHMKDGKELYQQPNLKEDELPPIPTEDNFFDVWGMKTFKQKQKEKEDEEQAKCSDNRHR